MSTASAVSSHEHILPRQRAQSRPSAFARLVAAVVAARQSRADRDIAEILQRRGGAMGSDPQPHGARNGGIFPFRRMPCVGGGSGER